MFNCLVQFTAEGAGALWITYTRLWKVKYWSNYPKSLEPRWVDLLERSNISYIIFNQDDHSSVLRENVCSWSVHSHERGSLDSNLTTLLYQSDFDC